MKLALYVQLFITQGQKGGPGVLAAIKILKFKAASNPWTWSWCYVIIGSKIFILIFNGVNHENNIIS
tara:strand:+ start:256 stop:456 length:201 start_codon:yes stop_codon:yes gene_type:complete